jgi:seryl-tRNA synthetase
MVSCVSRKRNFLTLQQQLRQPFQLEKAKLEHEQNLLKTDNIELMKYLTARNNECESLMNAGNELQAKFNTARIKLQATESKLNVLVEPFEEFEREHVDGEYTEDDQQKMRAMVMQLRHNILQIARERLE